ncbi:MAG: V-type ATP synthase subunit E [Promethearchaeota archaeon]
MSESLLELILENADKKKREILNETQKEVEKILAQARQDAEKIKQQKRNEAQAQASAMHAIELSKHRFQAKMRLQVKKQEMIETVYTEGFKKLQGIAASKDYEMTLHRFAVDGGVALLGGELEIFVQEQDKGKIDTKKCASEIKAKTGQETVITVNRLTKGTMGGCIVRKGNIFVDNTIEAMFERKKRDVRLALAKILFEGGT